MDDDFAIVVGIQKYAYLDSLNCPENDAKAFYEWVTAADGGAVENTRAALILGSAISPESASPMDMPPLVRHMERELDKLEDIAQENKKKDLGRRVGRRLYLYFAGHGCAPTFDEAAILAANASKMRLYHLTGMPVANWFYRAGYFREIVLLMDCCRESYERTVVYAPPWDRTVTTSDENLKTAERFYGLAAPWKRMARERLMEYDTWRGVFTLALLEGLRGAAYDPKTIEIVDGKPMASVTAVSLKAFLNTSMREFLSPEDRADAQVSNEPDIPHPRNEQKDSELIFGVPVPVPTYPVMFQLSAADVGLTLRVVRITPQGQFVDLASQTLITHEATLQLSPSLYLAQVVQAAGTIVRQHPFSVVFQTNGGSNYVTF